MRYGIFRIVPVALVMVAAGLPSLAQSPFPSYGPPASGPNLQCAPRQAAPPPVARNVQVRVPVPCGPEVSSPYRCGEVRHRPSPTMPVRVEVAVKPEPACDGRRIPVKFRDPGPFQPILATGAGLIGATVAAPFRLVEILVPWGREQPCQGPPPRPACAASGPPAPPRGVGLPWYPGNVHKVCAPPPLTCGVPLGACPPPAPSIAPLPPAPCPPAYGCGLPPQLVQDSQIPYWEPKSLLAGLWNLPARLLTGGRLTGDLGKPSPPCTR